MVGITEAMLKRRAEHNEGVLHTLEELVLQEEGLDRIDKILGTLCPHLKHLYMPNNLIPRIENLHRLKELQYLNLALNNITKIEGLEQCECLEKLDLTLNFVGQNDLPSLSKLSANPRLRELYLTGNPCQDWPDYRYFTIATLPSLKRLDGGEVKPSERIRAKQVFNTILEKLSRTTEATDDTLVKEEMAPTMNEKGQAVREYTPATRLVEHAEQEEMRGAIKADKEVSNVKPKKSWRHIGFDPLPSEGRIYQKNEGGWNFRLSESECKSKILLDIPVGRYMDISLIDIDVQPTLVRILVKGRLLQLQLPEEVNPDKSTAQRSNTTGNLLISLPKASCNARINVKNSKTSPLFYCEETKKPTEAKTKAVNETGSGVNICPLVKAPLKELLDASTKPGEHLKSKGSPESKPLDEGDFEDLPVLE